MLVTPSTGPTAGCVLPGRMKETDQEKLEEYFESVRETERRLKKSEAWVHTPKPTVEEPVPPG